jgi:hypothetical protein
MWSWYVKNPKTLMCLLLIMDLQGRPQHLSSEIQDFSKAVNVTLFWDENSGGELVVFGQADFNHFPINYFR